MRTDRYGTLRQGLILERLIVDLCSNVMDPIHYGRLFLAGDAASLISPSAAKGANLAIMEAEALAKGLIASLRGNDERPLTRYSAECIPRIWRAQEFSQWMINLLRTPPAGAATRPSSCGHFNACAWTVCRTRTRIRTSLRRTTSGSDRAP